MKKYLAILTLALASLTAEAKPIKLAWDYAQPAPFVIGFRVLYWQDGGEEFSLPVVGSETLEATINVTPGTWNAQVVAVELSGIQSDPSNLVNFFVLTPPANLRIVVP